MKQTDPVRYVAYLKKKGCKIGSNVHIFGGSIDMAFIHLISIGDNVTIVDTRILAHDASTEKFLGKTKVNQVLIGNNVFIGAGSIILPGSSIGDNTIIGAGTVVRGNIPDNSVVIGNPCKIVCSAEEYLEKNK